MLIKLRTMCIDKSCYLLLLLKNCYWRKEFDKQILALDTFSLTHEDTQIHQ